MKKIDRIISAIIALIFILYSVLPDVAMAQSINARNSDKLAVALKCDDLIGLQRKDIGQIELALEAQIMAIAGKGLPLDQNTFIAMQEGQAPDLRAIFNPPQMQFCLRTWEPKGRGVCVKCKVMYGNDVMPRIYYVLFSGERDADGGFPVRVYTKKEYERFGDLLGLVMPERKTEDALVIERFKEHKKQGHLMAGDGHAKILGFYADVIYSDRADATVPKASLLADAGAYTVIRVENEFWTESERYFILHDINACGYLVRKGTMWFFETVFSAQPRDGGGRFGAKRPGSPTDALLIFAKNAELFFNRRGFSNKDHEAYADKIGTISERTRQRDRKALVDRGLLEMVEPGRYRLTHAGLFEAVYLLYHERYDAGMGQVFWGGMSDAQRIALKDHFSLDRLDENNARARMQHSESTVYMVHTPLGRRCQAAYEEAKQAAEAVPGFIGFLSESTKEWREKRGSPDPYIWHIAFAQRRAVEQKAKRAAGQPRDAKKRFAEKPGRNLDGALIAIEASPKIQAFIRENGYLTLEAYREGYAEVAPRFGFSALPENIENDTTSRDDLQAVVEEGFFDHMSDPVTGRAYVPFRIRPVRGYVTALSMIEERVMRLVEMIQTNNPAFNGSGNTALFEQALNRLNWLAGIKFAEEASGAGIFLIAKETLRTANEAAAAKQDDDTPPGADQVPAPYVLKQLFKPQSPHMAKRWSDVFPEVIFGDTSPAAAEMAVDLAPESSLGQLLRKNARMGIVAGDADGVFGVISFSYEKDVVRFRFDPSNVSNPKNDGKGYCGKVDTDISVIQTGDRFRVVFTRRSHKTTPYFRISVTPSLGQGIYRANRETAAPRKPQSPHMAKKSAVQNSRGLKVVELDGGVPAENGFKMSCVVATDHFVSPIGVRVTTPDGEPFDLIPMPADDDLSKVAPSRFGDHALLPFGNRQEGEQRSDGKIAVEVLPGVRVGLDNYKGTGLASHGMMLAQACDEVGMAKDASGESVTGIVKATRFGGDWPSRLDLKRTVAVSGNRFTDEIVQTNVGTETTVTAAGTHPYYQLPGERKGWRLSVPAKKRLEFSDRGNDVVLPTGRFLEVRGTDLDFHSDGARVLGDRLLNEYLTDLVRDADGYITVELSDPQTGMAIRIRSNSPSIKGVQIFTPKGANTIAIEFMTHLPNPFSAGTWKGTDTGVSKLEPGETMTYRYEVEAFRLKDTAKPQSPHMAKRVGKADHKAKELAQAVDYIRRLLPDGARLTDEEILEHMLSNNLDDRKRLDYRRGGEKHPLPPTFIFRGDIFSAYDSKDKPRYIVLTSMDDGVAITSVFSDTKTREHVLSKGGARWWRVGKSRVESMDEKFKGNPAKNLDPLLPEGVRLAEAMFNKNPFWEVYFDGGKTVLLASPDADKETFVRDWAASSILAGALMKLYIAGPDTEMGSDEMGWIEDEKDKAYAEFGFSPTNILATTSRDPKTVGTFPHEEWTVTSIGVVETMLTALSDKRVRARYGLDAVESGKVSLGIMGFGDVGAGVLWYLNEFHKDIFDRLMIQLIGNKTGSIYCKDGLNKDKLIRIVAGIREGKIDRDFDIREMFKDEIAAGTYVYIENPRDAYFCGAEVLIPAARGVFITDKADIEKMKAKGTRLYVEGANNSIGSGLEPIFEEAGVCLFDGPIANGGGIYSSKEECLHAILEGERSMFSNREERRHHIQGDIADIAIANTGWLIDQLMAGHGASIFEIHRRITREIRAEKARLLDDPAASDRAEIGVRVKKDLARSIVKDQGDSAEKDNIRRFLAIVNATEIARERVMGRYITRDAVLTGLGAGDIRAQKAAAYWAGKLRIEGTADALYVILSRQQADPSLRRLAAISLAYVHDTSFTEKLESLLRGALPEDVRGGVEWALKYMAGTADDHKPQTPNMAAKDAPVITVVGSIVADVIVPVGKDSPYPIPTDASLAWKEDKEFKTPSREATDAYLAALPREMRERLKVTYGGPACASAMVLHELGAKVRLVCVVGNDALGRGLIESMVSKGMDVSGVRIALRRDELNDGLREFLRTNGMDADRAIKFVEEKSVPTSTNLIFSRKDTGSTAYNLAKGGANEYLGIEDIRDEDLDASVMHLGGIALNPRLMDHIGELIDRARSKKVSVGWDSVVDIYGKEKSPASLAAMAKADYLTPSIKEAKHFFNTEDPQVIMESFKKMGIPAVFLKNGENGSLVFTRSDSVFGAAAQVRMPAVGGLAIVDTLGAGDSYSAYAAFAAGLKMTPEDAAKGATVCGALTCERRGGGSIGDEPLVAFRQKMAVLERQLENARERDLEERYGFAEQNGLLDIFRDRFRLPMEPFGAGKTVLVTGGTGYIGSVTARVLKELGYNVVVYDSFRLSSRHSLPEDGERLQVVEGDIFDRERLVEVMRKYNVAKVVHFAADSRVPESVNIPSKYYLNNTLGTAMLLEAMREADVRDIVFSSTAATYGEPEKFPIDENDPQNPTNPYGHSKLFVEKLLRKYAEKHGFHVHALRYFNAVGGLVSEPGAQFRQVSVESRADRMSHIVEIFAQRLLKNLGVKIYGGEGHTPYDTKDGTAERDYIHIFDLAVFHALALRNTDSAQAGTGSFTSANCATGQKYSNLEIYNAVHKWVKKIMDLRKEPFTAGFEYADRRAGDPPVLQASPRRAEELYGYRAQNSDIDTFVQSAVVAHFLMPEGYAETPGETADADGAVLGRVNRMSELFDTLPDAFTPEIRVALAGQFMRDECNKYRKDKRYWLTPDGKEDTAKRDLLVGLDDDGIRAWARRNDSSSAQVFEALEGLRAKARAETATASQEIELGADQAPAPAALAALGAMRTIEEEVAAMRTAAPTAGILIPTHPTKRYTLLMAEEFFDNGELEEQRGIYGDFFNLDRVSGTSQEQFIGNILVKASGIEARSIALVPDDIEDIQLQRLAKAGVRFIRTKTGILRDAKSEKDVYRKKFQLDTYVTMLLARRIDDQTPEDSPIYRMLAFYLKSHFALDGGNGPQAIKDYIDAIRKNDITGLLKGILSYRPIQAYNAAKDYESIAKVLIAA